MVFGANFVIFELLYTLKSMYMEYWRSWIISSMIVLIGIAAKFILEIYLPVWRKKNIDLKKTSINSFMALFLIYLFGITVFNLSTQPWSEDLKVFAFFHLFLFSFFTGFLIIMRVFRVFFDDALGDGDNLQEVDDLQKRMFMW